MRRAFWGAVALLVALRATPLLGQQVVTGSSQSPRPTVDTTERGRAFLCREMTQEELARAVDPVTRGDSVLRACVRPSLDRFREAVRLGANLPTVSNHDFATLIRSLGLRLCGADKKVRMYRVLEPSGRAVDDYTRQYGPAEMCLYNNNSGRNVLSLQCGNPVAEEYAEVAVQVAPAVTAAPSGAVQPPRVDTLVVKVEVSGHIDLIIHDSTSRLPLPPPVVVPSLPPATLIPVPPPPIPPTVVAPVVAGNKSHRHWKKPAVFLAGIAAGLVVHNNWPHKSGRPATRSGGGPVDPPTAGKP